MKKALLFLFLVVSLVQGQNDSLVDVYDKDHKLLKLDLHLNDLLDFMEEKGEDTYWIREYKDNGEIRECKYGRRKEFEYLTVCL